MKGNKKMSYVPPTPVRGRDLFAYFNEHVSNGNTRKSGFFTLERPMRVFKKILHGRNNLDSVVNLIIPVGAEVYCPDNLFTKYSESRDRKMRASEAYVHSIYTVGNQEKIVEGFSIHQSSFKYRTGKAVLPDSFSGTMQKCASGIHFFMNVSDAYYY